MTFDDDDDDYEVGYRRPPKEHQFKKGGTKPAGSGRRKNVKNSRTIIDDVMNEEVAVTVAGKKQKMTKKEFLIRSSYDKAIKSNSVKESFTLARLFEKLAPSSMDPPEPIQIHSIPGDESL